MFFDNPIIFESYRAIFEGVLQKKLVFANADTIRQTCFRGVEIHIPKVL